MDQVQSAPQISAPPVASSTEPKNKTWLWILGGVLLLGVGIVGGVFLGRQITPQTPTPSPSPTPSPIPESPAVPALPANVSPIAPTIKYTVPADWLKYTDSGSGISISYPSIYRAKYNDNRGFGTGNFRAGSYLLDNQGKIIMDFYYFTYSGGSRREEFYKALDWDYTVDEIAKYTLSAEDLTLNGRSFLKLTMNFGAWHGSQTPGIEKRIFYLTTEGNRIIYFTFPFTSENENLTKIIATAQYSPVATTDLTQKTTCFVNSYGQPNASWSGQLLTDGSMQIVQKTDVVLSDKPVDKSRIEIWTNYQNGTYSGDAVDGFSVTKDTSLKGSYSDAFVIKINKEDVDRIKAKTPASVSSIAVLVKVSGGVLTIDNKGCYTGATLGYFAPK